MVALVLRQWWVAVAVVAAVVLKLLVREGRQGDRAALAARARRSATSRCAATSRVGGLSFVSGHAVIVTAVAGSAHADPAPGAGSGCPWVVVVLNGVARIYVGAHNPLDIVGGIGVGLVIAGLLNALLVGLRVAQPEAVVAP